MECSGSYLLPSGAQLPPQESEFLGPPLRFWGPSPKTPSAL
jgi:hypothetical protein